MFDLLKKKITGFIDALLNKEEKKSDAEIKKATAVSPQQPEQPELPKEQKIELKKEEKGEPAQAIPRETERPEKKITELREAAGAKKKKIIEPAKERKIAKAPEPSKPVEHKKEKKEVSEALPKEIMEEAKEEAAQKEPILKKEPAIEVKEPPREVEEKKREVKIGVVGQIKSFFTGEVEIADQDVEPLLQALEFDLLEADVGIDVATEIKNELDQALVGKKIKKNELNAFIKNATRTVLINIARNDRSFDILDRMKQVEKPFKIMFIGPNGSGKTTTISKIAQMLMNGNYKVVFGAADTFRAAAVEQIEVHAERLGVKTIKREYGSDPTAVAYDAVNYAKAHGVDAVLIDTAGRQDTNLNLINELKKMNRIIQPHLRIYVGESIAGNAIVEQVTRFNKEIGIDGIILTKLDCDPKGGTILSLSKITGIPIIYVGTGQRYEDLKRFDAEKMVDLILS